MKKKNKFVFKTLPFIESQCENCLWYLGNRKCPAFEGDIPDKVWNGEHHQIYKEQVEPLIFEENGPMI